MFKRVLPLLLVSSLFMATDVQAQWSDIELEFDGENRSYSMYIPSSYDADGASALVLTLHGLGDTKENFRQIGFAPIADTANFIILVPQALHDGMTGTAWNSRAGAFGIYPNTDIDDIGFFNAILDSTIANYSVNLDRIYVCGYSMGGFMTERLACEDNSRFAAFASVAGTMGNGLNGCNPGKAVPLAHFHGTADGTVGYDQNLFGISVDSLTNFWITNNSCDPTPVHTALPDVANDGYTVDHYLYSGGNADYELFKVNNADHVWLRKPTNDIAYTEEIWKFFNRLTEALDIADLNMLDFAVYPNPTEDKIVISLEKLKKEEPVAISLYSIDGKELYNTKVQAENISLSLKELGIKTGMYFVQISQGTLQKTTKIVVK